MNRVLIIGGGALAQQISHYITTYDHQADVIGFMDDTLEKGTILFNKKCLGTIAGIHDLYQSGFFDFLVMGIGYNHLDFRKTLYEKLSKSIPFYSFIHPNAFVDQTAAIGNGVVIGAGGIIEQRVTVHDNVFIYNSVSIAHDSTIQAHSFLAPSVTIAGFSSVGQCCFLGINTTVANDITIVDHTKTEAGTVIIKDISDTGVYIGTPAKKIK